MSDTLDLGALQSLLERVRGLKIACVGDPDLTPLAPYEALRQLVDGADSNEQSKPDETINGTQLLRAAFYDRPLTVGGVTLEGDGSSQVLTSVAVGLVLAAVAVVAGRVIGPKAAGKPYIKE